MNRPASRLLHDYKPAARTRAPKARKLQWFAVGLGLPLVGLMLILFFRNDSSASPPAIDYELPESVIDAEAVLPGLQAVLPDLEAELAPITLASTARLPRMQAVPEYDLLEFEIRSGDTLDQLFRRHDLDLGNLAAIVKLPEAGEYLKLLRPGDELTIRHDGGQLISLYRDLDLTHALSVSRGDSGYLAEIIERPIETHKRLAYGRIESSLFESAAAAGLPDKLIMGLAGIFAWDIDFVLDIRKGDDYYILYEEIYQDGKFVTAGDIVAAEFNNNGRTFRAVRYVDAEGRADYYTPEGLSVRKAFLRSPVDFTRVSSAFNPHRRHPILNTVRPHQGVDYAAPRGTPIKAAGDGKIIFRGRKGGYGNCVVIQHGGNITTLYAHMSGFANSAGLHDRVRQGNVIGYVGSSGLASGPHLHYEYRLNGVHRNPRTVELPPADPIREAYRADFLAKSAPILDELLQYKRTQVALAATVRE